MSGERQNGVTPPEVISDSLALTETSKDSPFHHWLHLYGLSKTPNINFTDSQKELLSEYYALRIGISLQNEPNAANETLNEFNNKLDETEFGDDPDFVAALRSITLRFATGRK